ncbi:alpha/beta hydrolase [Chryseobacterium nepalense]|uniref:Alpha/beta hydrolase-fold protein n=1 Tax=Chryseobacterium nepalense TaxID=1854498 RepID=A0ABY4K612_9FLAO|nr:alpha/beta hydrolase-fold protein [Chryseobacterium nepalense]UPQ76204.1 alpha/beta hydrolase-fold protein [Chryseobacterium nepalense]
MKNSIVFAIAFSLTGIFASAQNFEKQAPVGFDQIKQNIPHGKIDSIQYPSKTVGTVRKALIYTPPGFNKNKKYPVLYLLHGIGGDEKEWYKNGTPQIIIDNLYSEGKLTPMIVVLPNGRAMKDDRATGNIMAKDKVEAFATFEKDLLNDLIPFVEKKFPVKKDRENRALAGLSMGGIYTLHTGVQNSDMFSSLGVFSSGWILPSLQEVADSEYKFMNDNKEKINSNIKNFWISMGGKEDIAYKNCQVMMKKLDELGIKYSYSEYPGGHTWSVWRNNLYNFAQLLFKDSK